MGAFSTRPCENISHPSHAFKQHKSSAHHKWLEIKLTDNSVSVYQQMVPGFEKFNLYKKIPTYCTCVNASIQKTTWSKNLALMDSYGDHSVLQGSNHPWKIDPLNRNPLWLKHPHPPSLPPSPELCYFKLVEILITIVHFLTKTWLTH